MKNLVIFICGLIVGIAGTQTGFFKAAGDAYDKAHGITASKSQQPQLFEEYKDYWEVVNKNRFEVKSRADAILIEDLKSSIPSVSSKAIDKAKSRNDFQWMVWSATIDNDVRHRPTNLSGFIKAGAVFPRFDKKYLPLTFASVVRSESCYFSLDRDALDAILSIGADINDRALKGETVLDVYIAATSTTCLAYRLGLPEVFDRFYDDLHYLLDKGAIVNKHSPWLEKFSADMKKEGADTTRLDSAIERMKYTVL